MASDVTYVCHVFDQIVEGMLDSQILDDGKFEFCKHLFIRDGVFEFINLKSLSDYTSHSIVGLQCYD